MLRGEAFIGLSFFFVDLLNGVNGMVAASMRAALLHAHVAEVLLAAQAVVDKWLIVHLARR